MSTVNELWNRAWGLGGGLPAMTETLQALEAAIRADQREVDADRLDRLAAETDSPTDPLAHAYAEIMVRCAHAVRDQTDVQDMVSPGQFRYAAASLGAFDHLCVCTHPLSDHNARGLCTTIPGVLGYGCLGYLILEGE